MTDTKRFARYCALANTSFKELEERLRERSGVRSDGDARIIDEAADALSQEEMEARAKSMREAFYEIANRASNMFDRDAVDWMPSIYKIACEASGEDPSPMMEEYAKRTENGKRSLSAPSSPSPREMNISNEAVADIAQVLRDHLFTDEASNEKGRLIVKITGIDAAAHAILARLAASPREEERERAHTVLAALVRDCMAPGFGIRSDSLIDAIALVAKHQAAVPRNPKTGSGE